MTMVFFCSQFPLVNSVVKMLFTVWLQVAHYNFSFVLFGWCSRILCINVPALRVYFDKAADVCRTFV